MFLEHLRSFFMSKFLSDVMATSYLSICGLGNALNSVGELEIAWSNRGYTRFV